ncbi:hypothetical protein CJD36_007005 [Flavipsychrobacter stenotrophus]|uniref:Phosphatidic acid phosphatase type 2/haloperoxidase domain-containing protein n=1 Tax=Flavipsychrobacter stenotrophus TaxID=2077091 RepID=A0A2S7SX86_9BACT|nr:phosphatase PAP2 family protein [Flavipsychrobacter stenotrophus]PQJ11542.1 hypothetical protein CJD36_007005 [Flavipsychrobacter stenotrophus]
MQNKFRIIYRPWFHLPALLWVIVGAVLLLTFSKRELFAAVNGSYTPFLDKIMFPVTHLGQPEVIIPTLLILIALPRFRNWWYILTAIACNITPLLTQQIMKQIFYHPRPLKFYQHADWIHFIKSDWPELTGNNSFPSGHSQGAFSFFCFLTLLLPARYRMAGSVFFLLALSVCYSRMYLAAHFFEDVYTGSIIGVITTTLIYSFMMRYRSRLGAEQL